MRDEIYMRRAISLAKRGKPRINPMVGAVLVKKGKTIGEGYHKRFGAPHAEVNALASAGSRARGSTLYTNLEPCCYKGLTPPCTDEILKAGVRRVVTAMIDPNPRVSGKGISILRKAGLGVTTGVLEKEAKKLNEVFIKFITTGRPFVTVKCAMSADGKLATRKGESRWLSGQAAGDFSHRLRRKADAILVGAQTIIKDNPSLTARRQRASSKKLKTQPVRIVLDSKLRISPLSRVFDEPSPLIIATTSPASQAKLNRFKQSGAEVLVVKSRGKLVDIGALMDELGRRKIANLLIEGGGEVISSALFKGIVDRLLIFICPLIIGGRASPTPVGGEGIARLGESLRLSNMKVRRIGEDYLLEAKPQY